MGKRLTALVFWIAIWQVAATAVGQELLIPAPLVVARTLGGLMTKQEFWAVSLKSLLRIFEGFVIGSVLGGMLAILTSVFAAADLLISPIIRMVRATPVVSVIILILLWFQTNTVPVFISVLMVIPVLWENVTHGIKETDRGLLEMARAFRFGRIKTMWDIYVPAVMPYFTSGCISAMGLAWKAGIAAEVLCLPRTAIGTKVYYSKIYLETPSLFAWTLVVIVLSLLLERLLAHLLKRFGRGRIGRRMGG